MKATKQAGDRPRTLTASALGKEIESLARRMGMTRNDLARATGLSSQAMHMICNGKVREPKASTLSLIATALNVRVARLIPAVDPKRPGISAKKSAGGRPRTLPLSELGQRIENEMRRRGMNRNQLAAAAGISGPALHMICSGRVRDPKGSTLAAIARELGVPITRLIVTPSSQRSA